MDSSSCLAHQASLPPTNRVLLAWTFPVELEILHQGRRIHETAAALSYRQRKLMGGGSKPSQVSTK